MLIKEAEALFKVRFKGTIIKEHEVFSFLLFLFFFVLFLFFLHCLCLCTSVLLLFLLLVWYFFLSFLVQIKTWNTKLVHKLEVSFFFSFFCVLFVLLMFVFLFFI
jgi:hypothetical protein